MAHLVVKFLRRDTKFLRCTCVYLSHQNKSAYVNRRYSSDSTSVEGEQELTTNVEDDAEVMAARDVSRLPKKYRDRMESVMNPPEKPDWYEEMFQSIAYRRWLYGKFGRKSGLDPGILWPSREEVREQIKFEKDWEPSLEEMLESLKSEREEKDASRQLKRETVEKQMSRMPQFIKEYNVRLEKAADKEREQETKRRELLEEARDYFGYSIDPRDPRFEEMQLRKEEEEKKLRKKRRKERRALGLIQGPNIPK